jgi:hypothetical protein
MAKRKRQTSKSTAVTFETVRQFALSFPEVEEGTSYGTPAFKVRGKLIVRLHDSGHSIVVRIEEKERAMRMEADPGTYYITDHYKGYPWMLVRLSSVHRDDLLFLLEESWRQVAPKRLIAKWDAEVENA